VKRSPRAVSSLLAGSPKVGEGYLLGALELFHNDWPWVNPDDYPPASGNAPPATP
jgi:hypothetical protein